MTTTTPAALAAQVAAVLLRINAREAQYREWLAGTATGGPNGDGRYPVTNMAGETFMLDCPARLIDMIEGPASASGAARLLSEQARDAAVSARTASEAAADRADAAKASSNQSRALALQYRDDAAAHAANLQTLVGQLSGLLTDVATLKDDVAQLKAASA